MRKVWKSQGSKRPKQKVPESLKLKVEKEADSFIQSILKPEHIKAPPKDSDFNYLVDIYSKWYHSYFYFCATYRCPFPDAISEFFEARFARLEYKGNDRFGLSYMRHTGQWVEIYYDLTLEECLECIKSEPHYLP